MTVIRPARVACLALLAAALWPHAAHAQSPTPTAPSPTATPVGMGVVAPGATVERLASGLTFTEGPAADAAGDVFFSDVRTSRIHRWSVSAGALTTHREGAAGTNGLYFDGRGRLVVCESGARRMVREDGDGKITVLADTYGGKKLNSPNDVWIHPAGHIYFSDPRYGSTADVEQDGMHVYLIPADGGPLRRVTTDLKQPNGLIGTPDGRVLYITDAGDARTWRYRVEEDGGLADKSPYVAFGGDGMAIDERGNVYIALGNAVRVFSPGGAPLTNIAVTEAPSNMAFGGPDFRTLYITARTGFYAVQMAVRGADGPYAWAQDGMPTPTTSLPTTPRPTMPLPFTPTPTMPLPATPTPTMPLPTTPTPTMPLPTTPTPTTSPPATPTPMTPRTATPALATSTPTPAPPRVFLPLVQRHFDSTLPPTRW